METRFELDKETLTRVIAKEIVRQFVDHLMKHEFKSPTWCECGSDVFGEYSEVRRAFKCTVCGGFKSESELKKGGQLNLTAN